MPNPHNLDCQFYFLFRTQLWREGQLEQEPFEGRFNSILEDGIAIDSDKRLFRRDFRQLDQWQTEFKQAWADIVARYTATLPGETASDFYQAAFYGVIVLIMDENVARHRVEMALERGQQTAFVLPKQPALLFEVADRELEMPAPARCYAFEMADRQAYRLKIDSYPYLAPLTSEAYSPIFAVYAVEHSNGLSNFGEILPWVEPFQRLMCAPAERGISAVLVRVLPRVIMRLWQFNRIDQAARQQRRRLQAAQSYYQQLSALQCESARALEAQFRELEQLRTEAEQVQARIHQALQTLKINRANLESCLQRARRHYRARWRLSWRFETEAPLIEQFNLDREKLQNHQAYLQGDLIHLAGFRRQWSAHLESRRLKTGERLNVLLLIFTAIQVFNLLVDDVKLIAFMGVLFLLVLFYQYVTRDFSNFIQCLFKRGK